MRRLHRNARLTLNESVRETFGMTRLETLVIEPLRIQFAIEKSLGSDPNTCDVTITNPNDETLAFLQRKPLHLRLEAGHDGEFRLLFRGDVKYAIPKHEGTERTLMLQVADGGRAYRHATVNRSFAPGTPLRTVLSDVARAMNLELPTTLSAQDLDVALPAGDSLTGNARDALTRLLAPYGYRWSIQSGQLVVLQDGQFAPGEMVVLDTRDPDAAIIGAPALAAPSSGDKGGRPKLSLQCSLYPDLVPGNRVAVISRFARGQYRIEKVKHTGDTHGQEWTTEIEAKVL